MSDDAFWSEPLDTPPPDLPAPTPVEHIADGTHGELRWYVDQFAGDEGRTVTVQGEAGGRYVFQQVVMEAPTTAAIKRLCEELAVAPVKRGRK